MLFRSGGYATDATAFKNLQSSISLHGTELQVQPESAQPSFCSSSTYLVFLKVLNQLQKQGRLKLQTQDLQNLLISKEQADGVGVWGRWNANGPGTARLFAELGLGRNFTNIAEAKPGDFMKIFWSDEIGVKEHGHSVVFTGVEGTGADKKICYWSSQQSAKDTTAGMGYKCSPVSKIHRTLFSRLENLDALAKNLSSLSTRSKVYKDDYLNSLLKVSSSAEEMCKKAHCS